MVSQWKVINEHYKHLDGYKRVAWPPVSEERIIREFTPQPQTQPSQEAYYNQQQQQPSAASQQQYRASSYDHCQQQQQQQPNQRPLTNQYQQPDHNQYQQQPQQQPPAIWAQPQSQPQQQPNQYQNPNQYQQPNSYNYQNQSPYSQQPQQQTTQYQQQQFKPQYNSYSQPQQQQQQPILSQDQPDRYLPNQPPYREQSLPTEYRGGSPGIITLRKEAPISQKPAPVFNSQPAALSYKGGNNMRGDLKWPPQEYKEAAAKENEERRKLALGPVCRPRKVNRDYSSFFAKNALNSYYPSYKVPPGTQHMY